MSASAIPLLKIKHDQFFDHSKTLEFKIWVAKKLINDIPRMESLVMQAHSRNWDQHVLIATEYLAKKPVNLDALAKMCEMIARMSVVMLTPDLSPEQVTLEIQKL